jgi:hypothetical protein
MRVASASSRQTGGTQVAQCARLAPVYWIRTKGYPKQDPEKRWALPDRVFFACGACHVLAHAFLKRHGAPGMRALWLRPNQGFTGNHIFVATDGWVFDYHGYSERERFLARTNKRARRWWPGWGATLIELPRDVLVSEAGSRPYDGLRLREPGQFLHDAMPRALAYLDRFPAPSCAAVGGTGVRGQTD